MRCSEKPAIQAFINLMPAQGFSSGMFIGGSAQTRGDGTFQMLGIPPGAYTLSVRPRGPGPGQEFANVRITVGQDDLDNLQIVTSRGAIAYGVVMTDEGTVPPVPAQQVMVSARTIEPDAMIMGGESKVNEDFTFEITGLSERRLLFASIRENADWTLKAVLHNGIDVTDTPIDFVPGRNVEGLQLIFSRKRTELSGRITTERNLPETDATVIAFSHDPSRWGFATRYVRTARPSQDGRYTLRGLPPHDYLLVAVKDIEMGQWADPEFLEAIRSYATRVSLDEGGTAVQDLKVIRP